MSIYENANDLVKMLIDRHGLEGTVHYLTNLITSMNYELNFTQQQTDKLETLLKQRRSEIS